VPAALPNPEYRVPQFMGACTLDNGDTAILMELMLGGYLYEAIAGDRVSWYNRWPPDRGVTWKVRAHESRVHLWLAAERAADHAPRGVRAALPLLLSARLRWCQRQRARSRCRLRGRTAEVYNDQVG